MPPPPPPDAQPQTPNPNPNPNPNPDQVPHAALREPLHEALQSRWRQEAFYPIQIAVQQAGWAAAMEHLSWRT